MFTWLTNLFRPASRDFVPPMPEPVVRAAQRAPAGYLDRRVDYAAKCKRRRADGPTPCLMCQGECVEGAK